MKTNAIIKNSQGIYKGGFAPDDVNEVVAKDETVEFILKIGGVEKVNTSFKSDGSNKYVKGRIWMDNLK